MDVCALCRGTITQEYFRVAGEIVCPACVEKERVKDLATRAQHLRRGFFYSVGAAVLGSFVMFLVDALANMVGGASLLSAGAFLRGTATLILGAFIGSAARAGAKRRGSRWLQVSVVVLTYLAWSMAFVPLVLAAIPRAKLSADAMLKVGLLGPALPVLSLLNNVLNITGLVAVAVSCAGAWQTAARVDPVDGPFDTRDRMAERPMFKPLR